MKNISSNVSELIGQMIMVGIKGHDIAAAKDFFKLNQGYQIGGIILYDEDITISPPSLHNIRSPKQLQKLTSDLQLLSDIPLLVGVDQEDDAKHVFVVLVLALQSQYSCRYITDVSPR